jgi:hypothetical protein
MANPVLQYLREKDARFQSVDDSTLVAYLRERHPDLASRYDSLEAKQPSVSASPDLRNQAPYQGGSWDRQPAMPTTGLDIMRQQFVEPGRKINETIANAGSVPFSETAAGAFNALAAVPGAAMSPLNAVPGGQSFLRAAGLPFQAAAGLFRGGERLTNTMLPSVIPNPPLGPEMNQAAETIGAGLMLPPIAKGLNKVGPIMQKTGTKIMGTALQAGENLPAARGLAQFAVDRGLTMNKGGAVKAASIIENMKKSINEGIIDPATANGELLDPAPIRAALEGTKQKFAGGLLGDPNAARMIDRLSAGLEKTLTEQGTGGKLTTRQAQDFKVQLNAELERFYNRREKLGKTPLQNKKEAVISEANRALRSQLEELHPELRGLNWEEGQAIEIKKAIDQYLLERFKGDTGVKARIGVSKNPFSVASLPGLLGTRSFRSKLAVLLNKTGQKMTFPVTAPSDATRTIREHR